MQQEEEVTTKDIMTFMTKFRDSVEDKIQKTNQKLDNRMDGINKEIKNHEGQNR